MIFCFSFLGAKDDDDEEEEDEEDVSAPPPARRNPFKALWMGFCGNLPRKEDSTGTKVRKYGFLTSLLVMLAAIIYLLVDLWVIPAKNEKLKEELITLYHPEKSEIVVTPEEAEQRLIEAIDAYFTRSDSPDTEDKSDNNEQQNDNNK